MNIFILDTEPTTAAHLHCDKHVVKMILEAAQMLSTTHRMLDGTEVIGRSPNWAQAEAVCSCGFIKEPVIV